MSSDESRPEPDDTEDHSAAEPAPAGPEAAEETTTEPGPGETDTGDSAEDAGGEEAAADDDEDASDDNADGESADVIAGGTPRPASSAPPRMATLVTAAVALAALVVAGVFAVLWQGAQDSDEVRISQARDRVLNSATEAAVTFTALDSSKAGEYFARQRELAIGALLDEITASEEAFQETLDQAKTKVSSTVQDVAVEELNVHEGKADVLAVVQLEVTQEEADKPAPKTLRMQLRMERDRAAAEAPEDQPWKVAGVAEVPYGASG